MMPELEPLFQEINDILAEYTDDDIHINKVKKLLVQVQVILNPIPEECPYREPCGMVWEADKI